MLLLSLTTLWLSLPLAASLKFIVLGDWGTGRTTQLDVAEAMAKWATDNSPSFVVSTGDNFYNEGLDSVDDPRVQDYWRDVYSQSSLKDLPWYISVGNHDYYPNGGGSEWYQVDLARQEPRWKLPHLWHTATFDSPAGTVQLIILDSQAMRKQVNDWSQQIPFLEEALRKPDVAYNFVVAHHPIHTVARYGPGSGTMRNNVLPVLESLGADVFFCGHDHNMQHLRRRDGQGPDFILSGSGGQSGIYDENPIHTETLEQEGISSLEFLGLNGFVGVTVGATEAKSEFRALQNAYRIGRPFVQGPSERGHYTSLLGTYILSIYTHPPPSVVEVETDNRLVSHSFRPNPTYKNKKE